ncbi:MAG TPA: Gfo/Idh/MocA family oxidoreductase [Vicinamibacterales bacterium]|jgi:scyllo-inositol 2-dehydrogenase (NAD+)|nr:Gfo/Idh/MocA family oxidoreductase [Vicinamibacterales bacterium]
MSAASKKKLQIGLVGLGRLGRVYARDLSTRIAETKLTAVADTNAELAKEIAAEFDVPRAFGDPSDLLASPDVDAIVIVSPTHTHREVVIAAAAAGKPTFCEKPLAISLDACQEMQAAVTRHGTFFQMGFMRRFDPGYAAAKRQLDEGRIGKAVVFKSTSRDPYRPSLEYANPASSGGLLVDMGIHDFDLARWFMGEVASVSAVGGVLAYPEMATVGDIDNAITSLVFETGCLGIVDLSRNGFYGYDIATELLGTEGTIRIGYLRETPIVLLTKNSVAHDTVPYFMERFERAYTLQLQNFAQNVLADREPPVTIEDGVGALRVSLAATAAQQSGRTVKVADVAAQEK